MSEAWQKWLDGTLDLLSTLLTKDIASDASAEDVDKARNLLKLIACTVERGDAAAWRRLALAFDVVDIGGGLADTEPVRAEGDVDSTMPAVPFVPPSVDDTVALGEIRASDLAIEEAEARAPAGSTLLTGQAPVDSKGTVPIPVHMPAGVTASGEPSTSGGGTAPIHQPVPSSVLDIEKYAVLCAWTEKHPDRRPQLHAQYGLAGADGGERERTALDSQFEALFRQDARLRSAFDKRLAMHLRFLE